MAIKDITGMRSGRLVAVSPCGFLLEKNGDRRAMWRCKCDCGNFTTASSQEITLKRKQSCGCLRGRKRRVVEARAVEDIKVFKEPTKEFGEITVVVIDGECYFLFSEVDAVMQLESIPGDWEIYYPSILYVSVRDGKSWRIEDVPGVGKEQLLIEMRAVYGARDLAKSIAEWKLERCGVSNEETAERINMLHQFTWDAGSAVRKYTDMEKLDKRDEPLRKAMSEIIGEEIYHEH